MLPVADQPDATWSVAPYGLTPPLHVAPLAAGVGINNQVRVVETGAGQFLWKHLTHAAPPRIPIEHRLLAWLAEADLPFGTPQPLATASGETIVPVASGGWQVLFRWLPGEPLARHDPDTIAALGAVLGTLHGALVALPAGLAPTWASNGALAAIHPRVPDPATVTPRKLGLPDAAPYRTVLADWRAIVRTLEPFLAGAYRALPQQVIHGDFGPGNALAIGTRITAILDLASGLSLTLRYRDLPLPEALSLSGAFCAGYARTARPTPAEIAALPQLMLLREVVGSIWWLGRALVAGDLDPWFARFDSLLSLRDWLVAHEHPLLAAIERTIAAD